MIFGQVKLPLIAISFMTLMACQNRTNSTHSDIYVPEPDVYFWVIQAERAAQYGKYEQAVAAYLNALELSADERMAGRAVEVAAYAENTPLAFEAAQKWALISPDNPLAQLSAALWAFRADAADLVPVYARQAIGITNDVDESALALIAAFTGEQKPGAAAALSDVFSTEELSQQTLLDFGRFAAKNQEWSIGEQIADKVLNEQPDNRVAIILKASALMGVGQTETGMLVLSQAINNNPYDLVLRTTRGRSLVQLGQLEAARDDFLFVVERDESASNALYALAALELQLEDLVQAELRFKQLLRSPEHRNEAAYYLGAIAEEQNEYDNALNFYSQVKEGQFIAIAPVRKAQILAKQKDLEGARSLLREARKLDPQLENALLLAEGEILYEAGEYQTSYDVLTEGLQLNPSNRDLLYARSLSAERLQRIDLVELDLRESIALKDDDPQALNALGYSLANLTQRYDEAYEYIAKALHLAPESPAILDSMAWVLYRQGHLAQALTYIEQAYAALPDPEVAAHYGEILWRQGDKEAALNIWQQAEQAYADDPRLAIVQETRQRLLSK